MDFEFDPDKSASNAAKHGIGFESAMQLWADEKRLIVSASSTGEARFALIAE